MFRFPTYHIIYLHAILLWLRLFYFYSFCLLFHFPSRYLVGTEADWIFCFFVQTKHQTSRRWEENAHFWAQHSRLQHEVAVKTLQTGIKTLWHNDFHASAFFFLLFCFHASFFYVNKAKASRPDLYAVAPLSHSFWGFFLQKGKINWYP